MYDAPPESEVLSVASLPSTKRESSRIAKTYRQAAQLFLTRRFPEALSTIEPVITPRQSERDDGNGGDDHGHIDAAPIASASRGTRIKVWSFYLTFLNAIVELGPEEGKHAFGSSRWKELVGKARDGSIWEDVVRDGYGGVEGAVDGEVVTNLATLLLTHSPTQKLNQQRLETYLSSTAHPSQDIAARLESSLSHSDHLPPVPNGNNGTNTPRDLDTRLKLLELYTLHVLPRNDEWEYSKEFISMSEVLDEERKEAFLIALQTLQEEKDHAATREAELRRQQEERLEKTRKEADMRQTETHTADQERKGDDHTKKRTQNDRSVTKPSGVQAKSKSSPSKGKAASVPPVRPSKPPKKAVSPPEGLLRRASSILELMQRAVTNGAQSLAHNPMAILRTLILILAIIIAFARKELRERLRRISVNSWNKLRQTIGMGVKVSYL